MRTRVPLAIWLDDQIVQSETTLEAAGADAVLVISTTASGVPLTQRSVFVGAGGGTPGLVVDVVHTRGERHLAQRSLPGVPVTHGRASCLGDHAAAVQSTLERLTGQTVRVEITDAAADIAQRAFPPPA